MSQPRLESRRVKTFAGTIRGPKRIDTNVFLRYLTSADPVKSCKYLALLGLNISVLGLVDIPRSSLYLVAVVFGLIAALTLVYALVFMALEWKRLARERVARAGHAPDEQPTIS